MSSARSVVRGGAYSAGAMLCTTAAMLLVGKMFTNALPQSEVAVFVLILLAADLLNVMNNFGLASSIPKLVGAEDTAEQPVLLAVLLRFQRSVSLLLGAAVLILWSLRDSLPSGLIRDDLQRVAPYLWLLALLFVVGTFRDTLSAACAGLNRYAGRAGAQIAGAALHALAVFLFVWWWRGGIVALGLSTFAAHALSVAIMLWGLPRPPAPRHDASRLRGALRFSRPLHANACLHFVFQRFDTLLIAALLPNPATVAIYEVVKRVPLMFSRTLGALLIPFLPTIARHIADNELGRAAAFLNRAFAIVAFLGYLGVFAIVLVQEPLILLLFSPEYLDGAAVLGLLTVAICLTVLAGMMGQTLIALGRPQWVIRINVFMAASSIALNAALIPRFGIVGAAWAAIASAAFSCAAQTVCVRRYGIPLPVALYLKPHAVLAVAAAMLLLLDGYLARIVALLVFVAGSFLARIVSPRELLNLAGHLLPSRGGQQ